MWTPATGETVKEYPTITDDELRDAIARADRAHQEWSRAATVADRASLVRRVGELHSERRKELAEIIVAEMSRVRTACRLLARPPLRDDERPGAGRARRGPD